MIVRRDWVTKKYANRSYILLRKKYWRGWFLFGIIPLYIKQLGEK